MKFLGAAALLLATLSACVNPHPLPPQQMGRGIAKPTPTLADAIRHATRLGPAGPSTTVFLSFGLKVRNQPQLDARLASGRTVSAAEYAARFGPDPVLVQRAVATLETAGLKTVWQAPSSLIAADGPAPTAAHLLGVDIEKAAARRSCCPRSTTCRT